MNYSWGPAVQTIQWNYLFCKLLFHTCDSWLNISFPAKIHNRNCLCGLEGVRGQGWQLWICQSLFVSFFVFELAPTDPWQTPEKPFTVQAIRMCQRTANFMGTGSEIGSTLQKKSRGSCLSVLEQPGVSQWLPNNGTHIHTHTDHALQSTQTNKNTTMHWCTDSNAHKQTSCELKTRRLILYLTVGQWHRGLRSWIMGMFLSSVIYLAATSR